MGIIRLITVIAVIWLVWFFYKRFQQGLMSAKHARAEANKKNKSFLNVKKCAVCGVHVPESEVLEHNGRYYCSIEHKNGVVIKK